VKHIFFILLLAVIGWHCGSSEEKSKQTANTNPDSLARVTPQPAGDALDSLAAWNGKYPHEVKLLENEMLVNRLKLIIGEERFGFLKRTWQVEGQIQIENDQFVVTACEAHNCSATNSIIVYELKNKKFSVGVRQQGLVKTWTEQASLPESIQKWIEQN
jgi:hypothetical protein